MCKFVKKMKNIFALACLLLVGYIAKSQEPSIFQKNGLALDGYDVVAFFTEHKPVKGVAEFSYQYQGVQWLFSSDQHRQMFEKEPLKFLPQYGGYCAFGMSRGYKAPTEAFAFTLMNQKLYFNYNLKVMDVWVKDSGQYIKRADSSWVKFAPKNLP